MGAQAAGSWRIPPQPAWQLALLVLVSKPCMPVCRVAFCTAVFDRWPCDFTCMQACFRACMHASID